MMERLLVWLGGALFVASLTYCAYSYLFVWGMAWNPAYWVVHDWHGNTTSVGWYHFNPTASIALNTLLFGLFAIHHSVLARETVKARLARAVPERLLRPVYVWTASALLILICALWRPVGGEIYHVTGWRAVAHACVQLGGVLMIALSVRAIDPLELAGIRTPQTRESLQITGPYRWVRHPLYLGWMLAVFGAGHMTGDRLAFAVITSAYLVIAVPWEEQSLKDSFGQDYFDYTRRVRWRIVPYVF
jgi:protein-S-isoprenylcysteine O-methyltransferase Ste14